MNMTWRFNALDSLFFREARPFDSIGGSELSSVFPPPTSTLAGAIRSAIGEFNGVDWQRYLLDYPELKQQLGDSDSLGEFSIAGVFLSRSDEEGNRERLYPVPAHLVKAAGRLNFLCVGKAVRCDLGENVQLAAAPKDAEGEAIDSVKSLENHWLTQAGFEQVLHGQCPALKDLVPAKALFDKETRLGIGRNNQTRTAEIGLLYQTQHIRPTPALAIDVEINHPQSMSYPTSGIVRLGGEGRGASFQVAPETHTLPTCPDAENVQGIKLILLSSVYVPQTEVYVPLPSFTKVEQGGRTVWQGKINGIELTLHCAILGKALREGGWDLQNKKPKAVRSLVPAGSVFYCSVDNGNIKTALTTLHGQQIADQSTLDKSMGHGLLAVCPWFAYDNA